MSIFVFWTFYHSGFTNTMFVTTFTVIPVHDYGNSFTNVLLSANPLKLPQPYPAPYQMYLPHPMKLLGFPRLILVVPQPFQCWGYFRPKHKNANISKNHRNPIMLVFIGKLSLSALRWIPMCQGFRQFSGFMHHFVLAKLASTIWRVNISSFIW